MHELRDDISSMLMNCLDNKVANEVHMLRCVRLMNSDGNCSRYFPNDLGRSPLFSANYCCDCARNVEFKFQHSSNSPPCRRTPQHHNLNSIPTNLVYYSRLKERILSGGINSASAWLRSQLNITVAFSTIINSIKLKIMMLWILLTANSIDQRI